MKRLCALLLAALLLLSGCAAGRPDGSLPTLTVTFLDVGKADCILLEAEGRAAMIDAGNQGDAEEILALLSAKGISSLDFLLLTHLDKDHIGGADALIESVPIGTIYAPDYDKGNKQYDQYIAALTAAGIEPVHPTEPVDLTLGQAQITLLPGAQAAYEESNDYSIFLELLYGQTSFLFAGDAEETRLAEYLAPRSAPLRRAQGAAPRPRLRAVRGVLHLRLPAVRGHHLRRGRHARRQRRGVPPGPGRKGLRNGLRPGRPHLGRPSGLRRLRRRSFHVLNNFLCRFFFTLMSLSSLGFIL